VEEETVACPLCGQTAAQPVWVLRDRLCGLPGRFRLVRCRGCTLLYLNPRPTPSRLLAYYPETYESFLLRPPAELGWSRRWSLGYGLWKRCRLVRRYKKAGRLLDVGCGTGQFLAALRRFPGWEVAGVEPHPHAAAFARRTFGLPVHTGDLRSAPYPAASFDVVTLWDVLEHLSAPLADLAAIRRLLKPDGVLILRTPSADSWDARVFGPYWAGLDAPRHLAVYSRRTLAQLLRRVGFTIVDLRTGGGSAAIVLLSLRFLLAETSGLRRRLLALLETPVARLALGPPLALTDRLGLGSELVAVARPAAAPSR
jgi:SAM-dependent methyltransferase